MQINRLVNPPELPPPPFHKNATPSIFMMQDGHICDAILLKIQPPFVVFYFQVTLSHK